MSHVFVSYVRENQDIVTRLCDDLRRNSVEVWFDRDEIEPGTFWEDTIRRAISEGDFFIACFSMEYNSRYETVMNEELNLAISILRRRPRDRSWFIPVLLSGYVPDWDIGGGKTLSSLQRVNLSKNQWDTGIQEILSVIRPVRVQRLLKDLHHAYARVRVNAAHELGKVHATINEITPALINALRDKNQTVRANAAAALRERGDCSKEVVLNLARLVDEQYTGLVAQDTLRKFGDPAARVLTEALGEDNEELRVYAANALTHIYLIDSSLVTLLGRALMDDSNSKVRRCVAEVLRWVRDVKAVSPLVHALRDEDEWVRVESAESLSQLRSKILKGSEGLVKELIPVIPVLNDEGEWVRKYAAEALGELQDKAATGPLVSRLVDESCWVRESAAKAVGNITGIAAPIELINTLQDDNERVRQEAARALGKLGDPAAVEALLQCLGDVDGLVRANTATALGELGDIKALEPLIDRLDDESEWVRAMASEALGALRDNRALEALIGMLRDPEERVRMGAAWALSMLGEFAAVQPLMEALEDKHSWVRVSVARALGRLGNEAAVEPLVSSLSDEDGKVRENAMQALINIGTPEALRAAERHKESKQ